MKISVLIDQAGDVISAILPSGPRQYEENMGGFVGIDPSPGQTLRELDVPDDQIPSDLVGPEFQQTLQQLLDESGQPRQ